MDELLKILKAVKPGVNFENEKDLIEDGILESFEILQIIAKLKSTFEIEIKPSDIVPENFSSAESMWEMVERLEDE